MATSGSIDFQLTSRQVVVAAMRLLNVLDANEDPADYEATQALQALTMMLKTWGAQGRLWLVTEGTQALTASQITYTLTGVRKVLSVRRRTSNMDLPLSELSRSQYDELPNKTQAGTPLSWYFDPQRSTKTLYIWPTASTAVAASTTLVYTYARFIEDCDSLDNDPDVPQEWFEPLVYGLARRIGLNHARVGTAEYAEIKSEAERLYATLAAVDQESVSLYFQPGQH